VKKFLIAIVAFLVFSTTLFADNWSGIQNFYFEKTYTIKYTDILGPIPHNKGFIEIVLPDTTLKSQIFTADEIGNIYSQLTFSVPVTGTYKAFYFGNPNTDQESNYVKLDSTELNFIYADALSIERCPQYVIKSSTNYQIQPYIKFIFRVKGKDEQLPDKLLLQYSTNGSIWQPFDMLHINYFDTTYSYDLKNNYPTDSNFKLRVTYLSDESYTLAETDWIEFKTFENSYFNFIKSSDILPYDLRWQISDDLKLTIFTYTYDLSTLLDENINMENKSHLLIGQQTKTDSVAMKGLAWNDFIQIEKTVFFYDENLYVTKIKKLNDSINTLNNKIVDLDSTIVLLNNKNIKLNFKINELNSIIDSLNTIKKDTTIYITAIYSCDSNITSVKSSLETMPQKIKGLELLDRNDIVIIFNLQGKVLWKYEGPNQIDIFKDALNNDLTKNEKLILVYVIKRNNQGGILQNEIYKLILN
jgi:hypothetical protein